MIYYEDDECPEALRYGRDCEKYGHHWEHFYGGGIRCPHCGEEN